MRISEKLEKRLIDVSVKLTEKEKENIFFRQRNPQILIQLAKYNAKTSKKTNFKELVSLYELDLEIRVMLFILLQKLEEKLTGYLVQHIAYDKPDFHLQSKNFKLNKNSKKRNAISHFKTVDKFIFDLKRKHSYAINGTNKIPDNGFIEFEQMISLFSLGMKAKLLKYSNNDFSDAVLTGFNMRTSHEKAFSKEFFTNLNNLRNRVMHHNTVIDWTWKSNWGTFTIYEFVEIATFYLPGGTANLIEHISELDGFTQVKKMTKREIQKIINSRKKSK